MLHKQIKKPNTLTMLYLPLNLSSYSTMALLHLKGFGPLHIDYKDISYLKKSANHTYEFQIYLQLISIKLLQFSPFKLQNLKLGRSSSGLHVPIT